MTLQELVANATLYVDKHFEVSENGKEVVVPETLRRYGAGVTCA